MNFGDSGNSSTASLLGILGVSLLFSFILFYVNMNLRHFRKISAAEAIRFGSGEKAGKTGKLRLSKNKFLSTNLFLGISGVLARKRLYGTLLAVVMLAAFIIIVPQNLYHTISSENFVTYMGVGLCDLRMDIQQNGKIALSSINAENWNKCAGDSITLLTADGEKTLSVCGIYSDVTNGGKTAKAVFSDDTTNTAWSIVCVSFFDQSEKNSKLSEYKELFDFARVSSIDNYILQTFGQTLRSVRTASLVFVGVAIAAILLVPLLFLKLLVAKDAYSITVLKAMGYTNTDLKWQFAWKVMSVLVVGIVLGTLLAGTLGEKIAARAQCILFMQDGKIVSQLNLAGLTAGDNSEKTEKILAETKRLGI